MVNFGIILRELRKQMGMSQNQLAKRLGVSKSVISYYERSERMPSPDVLMKLAAFFHVSTDYLLGLDSRAILDVSDLSMEDVKLLESIVIALRIKNSRIDPDE